MEARRVVPGVLGHAPGIEREEVPDGLGLDVDPDGIDQDESGDGSVGVPYGHFRGDPAADRRADEQDVAQPAVVEKVQVGEGEVIDAGEPVRPVGPVPSRVHRCDGVHGPGEVGREPGDGGRASAAVQDQARPAGTGFGQCEGQVLVQGDALVRRHAPTVTKHVDISKLSHALGWTHAQ